MQIKMLHTGYKCSKGPIKDLILLSILFLKVNLFKKTTTTAYCI